MIKDTFIFFLKKQVPIPRYQFPNISNILVQFCVSNMSTYITFINALLGKLIKFSFKCFMKPNRLRSAINRHPVTRLRAVCLWCASVAISKHLKRNHTPRNYYSLVKKKRQSLLTLILVSINRKQLTTHLQSAFFLVQNIFHLTYSFHDDLNLLLNHIL